MATAGLDKAWLAVLADCRRRVPKYPPPKGYSARELAAKLGFKARRTARRKILAAIASGKVRVVKDWRQQSQAGRSYWREIPVYVLSR